MIECDSKSIKFKVQAGMVCAFDFENKLAQRDSEITHVLVIEKVKPKLFGKSRWLVQNADDPNSEPFTCPEFLLNPLNVSVLRFPTNIPEFNDIDIDVLEYFSKILNNERIMMELCSQHNNPFTLERVSLDTMKKKVDRLKAIYEKVKFCKELRDV